MNTKIELRHATPADFDAVARLIHSSTNHWYESHGRGTIFGCEPAATRLFCDVYEDLDPGRCLVATDRASGEIVGSCFYHPRETHVSLGIMNSHPAHAGKGIARDLLAFILDFARSQGKPLRLVSSAVNLDSFSLYNRAGMIPYAIYQDMILASPAGGVPQPPTPGRRARDARPGDVDALVALEEVVLGIRRPSDLRYFIENRSGDWHMSVLETDDGRIDGFLASIVHPASSMLGPGCARDDEAAIALVRRELDARRGRTLVWLVPCDRPAITSAMYALGARNCEMHLGQTTGAKPAIAGVVMPTFMPETG